MARKHLKRVRAEKSKIHFKKKVLPKGQNVTNTVFTVKKILTLEQLKKVYENEPGSNWNLPLKDLLVKLNHYNVTSKLNGLHGIKELLNEHLEILKGPPLQSLINKLLELIIDEEPKVRVTTVDILTYIFNLIPSTSKIPFYDILNVYLKCAMTHRNSSVQQDSVRLMDIMIKYTPEAVRNNFEAITKNFLRIIKSYLYETPTKMFNVIGCKQHSAKTKTNMLLRFYKILVVGFSNVKHEKQSDRRSHNINILTEKRINLRALRNQYKNVPDLSVLFKCSEDKDRILTDFGQDEFQFLCSLTIPMLIDTWTEYLPNQAESECILSEDIEELLLVILKIFSLLYSEAVALDNEKLAPWFVLNYGPAFQKSFTFNFPCTASVSVKESKASSNNSKGFNIFTTQNLIICHLSYLLKTVQKNSNIETKIENYLLDILMMTNPTDIEILSKIVEVVINDTIHENSCVILGKVVEAYSTTTNLELRHGLSKALMKVVLKENEYVCLKDKSIVDWMKSLSHCLCDSQIFIQELETILKLTNQPTGIEIIKEIECKAEEIIKNLSDIKIQGIAQLEGQKMIANILYRCSNEVLKQLMVKNLDNMLYLEELKNYMRDIFTYKLRNQSQFFKSG